MLSLSLPLQGCNPKRSTPKRIAPNAFIRIGTDGQIVLTMPYVEWARAPIPRSPCSRGRTRGRTKTVLLGMPTPTALRKSRWPACRRLAAKRGTPAWRHCARPVRSREHARLGGGETLECGCFRAARKAVSSSRADGRRLKYGELAADAAHMPVPESVAPATSGFRLGHRQAFGRAGEGQRNGRLWHRRSAAGVKIATLAHRPCSGS